MRKAMARKPGRPRGIPDALVPKVLSLYRQGMGYRRIASELRGDGICVDWSTVRRLIKAHMGSGGAWK